MDILSYILSRNYVRQTLKGMGALKGSPCKIYEINDNHDGTYEIVFTWTDTDNQVYYDSLVLSNGETPTITSEPINGGNRVTFTTTNPPRSVFIDVLNGTDGRNGIDGKDGIDGTNGISIVDVDVNNNNHLMITLSNEEVIDAGEIQTTKHLVDMEDVSITNATDGDVLVYNETTQKWENQRLNIAVNLEDLKNVDISNLTLKNGSILVYNSTKQKWENGVIPTPTVDSLNNVGDVDINNPTSGQVLKYDSTTQKWKNEDGGSGEGYTAGNGIDITNQVISIDDSIVLTQSEFDTVTPSGVSNTNKLVDFKNFNTTLEKLELIEDVEQYRNDNTAFFVTDYGAVGDGVTDDSQAFINAINAGYLSTQSPKIIVPRGQYNLNHVAIDNTVILSKFTLIGESAHFCEIIDANISAQYGIMCHNVMFTGGTLRDYTSSTYSGIGVNLKHPIAAIWCTPLTDNVSLEYTNCIFRGTEDHPLGAASMAYDKRNNEQTTIFKVASDVVRNCLFENITDVGIYHRMYIINGLYDNNIFRNFGYDSYASVTIHGDNIFNCLTVSDTSNSTSNRVDYCIIKNNIFDTFKCYETTDGVTRTGAFNFVCMQGDGIVCNNQFKNLLGYGHDREGLYTKSNNLEIYNNYFENAGLGEGYICCKKGAFTAQNGKPVHTLHYDREVNIYDNFLVGDSGNAIEFYACGAIHGNYIHITNAKQAIDCTSGFTHVDVYDNYIKCGFVGDYYVNGQPVNNYHKTITDNGNTYVKESVVKFSNYENVNVYNNTVVIDDNITTGSEYKSSTISLIHAQSTTTSINIRNNKLYSNNSNKGIYVENQSSVSSVDSSLVQIEKNVLCLYNIRNSNSTIPIHLTLYNNVKRYAIVKNNIMARVLEIDTIDPDTHVETYKYTNTSTLASYGLVYDTVKSGVTYDTETFLEFDSQQNNLTWKRYNSETPGNYVSTNAQYVNTPNRNYIS